jgi:putative DNA primase/helicase
MRRRLPGEPVQRADTRRLYADLSDIRRRITRWVQDGLPDLRTADPVMPPTLDDRAADNWRPLLALADAAGGRWPSLARETAVLLSGERAEEPGFGVALLEDIRTLFGTCRVVASDVMLEGLTGLSERPWATWTKQGKPMTQRDLAGLLKRFGIRPGTVRVGEATPKGYTLADFEDSFARYIPDFLSATPPHVNDDAQLDVNTHPPHSGDVADSEDDLSSDDGASIRNCGAVADRKPEPGEGTIYDL